MSRPYEKHGTLGRMIYENAIAKLLKGEITVEQAMTYIMEFSREAAWLLVVDENLRKLGLELAKLGYRVQLVPPHMQDDEIIRKYADRGVFITENTDDFKLRMVPDPFREGMILVPGGTDARRLSRVIERLLMGWVKRHPLEPAVKIGKDEIARLLKGGPAVRRRRSRRL